MNVTKVTSKHISRNANTSGKRIYLCVYKNRKARTRKRMRIVKPKIAWTRVLPFVEILTVIPTVLLTSRLMSSYDRSGYFQHRPTIKNTCTMPTIPPHPFSTFCSKYLSLLQYLQLFTTSKHFYHSEYPVRPSKTLVPCQISHCIVANTSATQNIPSDLLKQRLITQETTYKRTLLLVELTSIGISRIVGQEKSGQSDVANKCATRRRSFSFYVSFSYCMRFLFFVTYIIVIYTLTNYLLSISSIKDVVELLDNSLLKSPKNRISSTTSNTTIVSMEVLIGTREIQDLYILLREVRAHHCAYLVLCVYT